MERLISSVVTLTCLLACLELARADLIWTEAAPFNSNAATDTDADYYMHMATDGAGHVVSVWCAAVTGASNRDFDILTTRSADYGFTWTAPTELDPSAIVPPEIEDDFHPFVVTDGAGNWVATWYTHDDHGGTIGADTDILVSRSSDNGATWTPSAPLNSDAATDTTGDSTPSIATDGNGLWVAVSYKMLVDLADYDLIISQSTDNGQTWSSIELLHPSMATDAGDDGSPSIITDKAGHWMVVWHSDEPVGGADGTDLDIFVSVSTDGVSWSAPAPVNSDAADSNGLDDKSPRLATDGAGRWLAVWYYGEYPSYDIKYAYSDNNGATWSPVAYLNSNAHVEFANNLYPVPATDGVGNWIVVWQSKDPLGGIVGASDYDIFYAASTDNGASWSPVWYLNSYAPFPGEAGYDRDPEIVYLGGHRWLTVWGSTYDVGGIGIDYDLLQATTCFPRMTGDQDCDGDVDLYDFRGLQECFGATFPLSSTCAPYDIDTNGAVNLGDMPDFAAALSGPAS